MKLVFMLIIVVLASAAGFAAPADLQITRAVLDNITTEQVITAREDGVTEFTGIEKTQTYRTPGAFEYTLHFRSLRGGEFVPTSIRLQVAAQADGTVTVEPKAVE